MLFRRRSLRESRTALMALFGLTMLALPCVLRKTPSLFVQWRPVSHGTNYDTVPDNIVISLFLSFFLSFFPLPSGLRKLEAFFGLLITVMAITFGYEVLLLLFDSSFYCFVFSFINTTKTPTRNSCLVISIHCILTMKIIKNKNKKGMAGDGISLGAGLIMS